MKIILDWLDGKKTYICGLACALTMFAYNQGWIFSDVRDILLLTFGYGTLASLRVALNKR